ncbi:MAG TPA: CopD family protein [Woeseiaceae bacterium]|nr:CopD family protein [Woeseiaceae bacterium]
MEMQLSEMYLWLKALHLAFMVTWFAGLFYLPRLFIYHAQAESPTDHQRFTVMERRLFIIMTIGAGLTALFGGLMLHANPGLLQTGWFRSKLVILVAMLVYHYRCWRWIRVLGEGPIATSTRWLRWFNEIPAVFLLVVILLAVLKPF